MDSIVMSALVTFGLLSIAFGILSVKVEVK
jgi:hypothetical protein